MTSYASGYPERTKDATILVSLISIIPYIIHDCFHILMEGYCRSNVFRHTVHVLSVKHYKQGVRIITNHGFKRESYNSGSVVSHTQFKKYRRFPFSAGNEFSIITLGSIPVTVLYKEIILPKIDLQMPGVLATFGRSDRLNCIHQCIRFLILVFGGRYIPAKGGQGHWIFPIKIRLS